MVAGGGPTGRTPPSPSRCQRRAPQLIYMHWMNTVVGYCGPFGYQTPYCEKLRGYLQANLVWMEEQMASGQRPEYWHQVRPCPSVSPPPVWVQNVGFWFVFSRPRRCAWRCCS